MTILKRLSFAVALCLILVLESDPLAVFAQSGDWSWSNVAIWGGGFVDGVYFHPKDGSLIYSRTDVGGAYRFDSGKNGNPGAWIPLLDGYGYAQQRYQSVQALALDPNDPGFLYLAVGGFLLGDGSTCGYLNGVDTCGELLISHNHGDSFTVKKIVDSGGNGLFLYGNGVGRNAGERLTVDPNNSNILYFGSPFNGLLISTDSGASWGAAGDFNTVSTHLSSTSFSTQITPGGYGVTFVIADPSAVLSNRQSKVIYAGIAKNPHNAKEAFNSGVYISQNGGSTWSPMTGYPTGLIPTRADFSTVNKELYVAFNNDIGPSGITGGQLWKYNPATSKWTHISVPAIPSNIGYGAINVDPSTGYLYTASIDNPAGDQMYQSSNRGANWAALPASGNHVIDGNEMQSWLYQRGYLSRNGNWITSIAIDPANPKHAIYASDPMIWGTYSAAFET